MCEYVTPTHDAGDAIPGSSISFAEIASAAENLWIQFDGERTQGVEGLLVLTKNVAVRGALTLDRGGAKLCFQTRVADGASKGNAEVARLLETASQVSEIAELELVLETGTIVARAEHSLPHNVSDLSSAIGRLFAAVRAIVCNGDLRNAIRTAQAHVCYWRLDAWNGTVR